MPNSAVRIIPTIRIKTPKIIDVMHKAWSGLDLGRQFFGFDLVGAFSDLIFILVWCRF